MKTRIQRADTRPDIAGIHALIEELQALPCDQQSVIEELEVGSLVKRYDADDPFEFRGLRRSFEE